MTNIFRKLGAAVHGCHNGFLRRRLRERPLPQLRLEDVLPSHSPAFDARRCGPVDPGCCPFMHGHLCKRRVRLRGPCLRMMVPAIFDQFLRGRWGGACLPARGDDELNLVAPFFARLFHVR